MTARIEALKALQWNRVHHAARCTLPDDMPLPYRDPARSDVMRCAMRTSCGQRVMRFWWAAAR